MVPFLTYYAIGNYLRLYKDNFFSKKKNRAIVAISSIAIIILSIIAIDLLSLKFSSLGKQSARFIQLDDSIFVILIAVPVFCAIAYKKEFYSKVINLIASTTFGIYLIHDNRFIRQALWGSLFHNPEFVNSPLLIPHMLGAVLCVFVGCSIIEYIRINTLERAYVSLLAPQIDKVQENIGRKIATKIPE